MHASLLFLVSLAAAVSCHPLLVHIEKARGSVHAPALLCPDTTSTCPDGDTCCKLHEVDGYGCCPEPQAECCDDGIHCCPHGYKCSPSNKCSRSDVTIAALRKRVSFSKQPETVPAKRVKSPQNVICPDNKSQCATNTTCCKLASGVYGCCPRPNAVCCSDGKHCCPEGYDCNVNTGKCTKGNSVLTLLEKQPAINAPQNVVCPDGSSQCSSGQTCCKLASGAYGCCPQLNAVCCSDGKHCCPEGYDCNVNGGTCTKGNSVLTLLEKQPAINAPQNVVCPDGSSQCKTGQTCCKLASGKYGCCPQPNADCCSDGKHCCPAGYDCDLTKGTCTKGNSVLTLLEKQPAALRSLSDNHVMSLIGRPRVVVCPDSKSMCPDKYTCCKNTVGGYGCCALDHAVCCADGKHCCPDDYACNLNNGTCTDSNSGRVVQMYEKIRTEILAVEPKNVICPDQREGCDDGTTCCAIAAGGYGCCPEANATCCTDKKHCCPEGYKCGTNTCEKKDIERTPERSLKAEDPQTYKPCPGTTRYFCRTTETCCRNENGTWECCPYVNAQCCDDHKSCCDYGSTCYKGHCKQSGFLIPSGKRRPAVDMQEDTVKSSMMVKSPQKVCPDGNSQCTATETCCKLDTDSYGCCPGINAVCCSDGKHCCPDGYTCSLTTKTCAKGDSVLTLLEKQPAIKSPQNVVCPDGQSECADNTTCCKLASGVYGCCPQPNAVCCGDGKHCCPAGYTCDLITTKCTKGDSVVEMYVKQSSIQKQPAIMITSQNVICPDQQNVCSDDSTCCQLDSGEYGCCDGANAVCCSDGEHCCPEGYSCDETEGGCTPEYPLLTVLEERKAIEAPLYTCPDGVTECYSSETCCPHYTGGYACCPEVIGVCCSDDKHCCPYRTTCSWDSQKCLKEESFLTLLSKQPAVKAPQNIVCPDNKSECQSNTTCCKLASGVYGCCPQPNAVCCSDGKNCCPFGYKCNNRTCTKGNSVLALLEKQPAINAPQNDICPDGTSQCSSGQTCCKLASGDFGCCPESSAVCCSDGKHCCPEGYSCDTTEGKCTLEYSLLTVLEKRKTIEEPQQVCPDGTQCASDQTCCPSSAGGYECCPNGFDVCCSDGKHCCSNDYSVCCSDGQLCCSSDYPVCCSDGKHCCPEGSTCSAGKCYKGNSVLTFFKEQPGLLSKRPATVLEKRKTLEAPQQVCPDGTECDSDDTCCPQSAGGGCCASDHNVCCSDGSGCCASDYPVCCGDGNGCCPSGYSVCCSDGKHCCPDGTICVGSAGCLGGNSVLNLLSKQPAIKSPQNVVCPDGTSQCKSGQTCCKLASGEYGCCPQPNAVCCGDGVHCCPEGYTCGMKDCSKGDSVLTFLKKQPAHRSKRPAIKRPAIKSPQNVICPDGQSQCADNTTCCKLDSGVYGCCPEPGAVCCSDGKHCCPKGYSCDTTELKCTLENSLLTVLEKRTSIEAPQQVCPDGTQCDSGGTCCSGGGCCSSDYDVCCSDGQHCCSSDYSVCCSDGEHCCASDHPICCTNGCCASDHPVCCSDGCCPEGYTCGVGECIKGDSALTFLKKQPFHRNRKTAIKRPAIKSPQNIICPDNKSECQSNATCCKLASGVYGCCPRPNAVCCSDGKHCCPEGYDCNVNGGTCTKGNSILALLEKQPAINAPQNVVCPDGSSQCKTGQTCCKLASGEYGCCPEPSAVCCGDGKHCCPEGYACSVGTGRCLKGDSILNLLKKQPAVNTPQNVPCPDGTSACADNTTCCKLASGVYGCCPEPNADCCSDGKHCCPNGYSCSLTTGTCTKGDVTLAAVEKKLVVVGNVDNVICPNESSQCPNGNTCCKKGVDLYNCCPTPNAVCCSDGEHCCPKGYVCNIPAKTCDDVSKGVSIQQLTGIFMRRAGGVERDQL